MSVLVLGLILLGSLWPRLSAAAVFACADVPCLLAAVAQANVSGERNVIELAAGDYVFTQPVARDSEGDNALPPITSELVIRATSTPVIWRRLETAPLFRFLHVLPGGDLTLRTLTLQGGAVSAAISQDGGCILSEPGTTLRVVDSILRQCEARNGGALRASGRLEIIRSALEDNLAHFVGGALASDGPAPFIQASLFRQNTADTDGAAFLFTPAGSGGLVHNTVFLSNTSFRSSGGAMGTQSPDLQVVGSFFDDNHASTRGGAIVVHDGALLLRRSVLTHNTAPAFGGGLSVQAGPAGAQVTLDLTAILNNRVEFGFGGGVHNTSQTPIEAQRSRIAGNQAPIGPDCFGSLRLTQSHLGTPEGCLLQ